MTEGREGFFARLRRLFGGKPAAPARGPRDSRTSRASLPQQASPFAKPEATVRYMKERGSQRLKVDPSSRRKRFLIIGGTVFAMLLIGCVALYLFIVRTTIPEMLVGTWKTDDPRYAARRFELLEDQVVFQVGDSTSAVLRYPVVRVMRGRSSRGRLYRVRYTGDENATFEFRFTWQETNNEIRLANQPTFTWVRTGPPSPRPRLIPD